ncbi:MAG: rhodanese-like domain-containing protein [Myxococcaceae bacterium]|nr:rhodanese-like domain-containing protein [Myxococcaceae bacterium]
MRRYAPAVLLAAAIGLTVAFQASAGPFIPPEEARALVKKGAVLVDVRTPEEFASGHIEGAINIPVDQLDARKGELKKDAELVLYCRSGARSARGQALLKEAGYPKVHNLGGISNWK